MSERPVIIDIGYIIGGDEGHYLVEKLLAMFTAWSDRHGLAHEVLAKVPAFCGGLESAKLTIFWGDRDSFAALHQGAHTMIRTPPNQTQRHISVAGVRVSDDPDTPLPDCMADWGDERRRYFFDPNRAVSDTRLGRLDVDPDVLFDGDFSALGAE
jgi:protein subunit release factor B